MKYRDHQQAQTNGGKDNKIEDLLMFQIDTPDQNQYTAIKC